MTCIKHGPAIALLAALTACGAGAPGNKADGAAASAIDAPWAPLGKCTPTDLSKVAVALQSSVGSASLVSQSPGGDDLAAVTTCNLTLADGTALMLLARRSPRGDVTPQSVEQTRTMGGTMPPGDEVPGTGVHAFWTAQANTLQVFYDDTRFASVTLTANPKNRDAKVTAGTIAKAIG